MKAGFTVIALLFAVLLLISPRLGPADEYAFLPTLQSGKWFPVYGENFPYYDSTELGRFGPLGGQEYNLVALFTTSPVGYFAFNALELLLCAYFLLRVLKRYSAKPAMAYLAGVLLLLTPGFILVYLKLLYVEKNVLFLLAAFMLSYLSFQERQRAVYLALSLLCANAAIYYKEPVFAAIFVFATGHLFLAWKGSTIRSRFLDGALIASALLYIGIYLATVWPQHGPGLYAPATTDGQLMVRLKNVMNYALFSDPIPVLLLLPLTVWRVYRITFCRSSAHPVLDPMLGAGTVYVAVFFVLNMYGPYYLLPAYLFALPPIVYYLSRDMWRGAVAKGCLAFCALALAANAVPLAIHYLSYNKYVPLNFDKTVDFLVDDINRRYDGLRLSIFFDGVNRGTGLGVYFIVGEYLKFKGLPLRKFDFKSDMEAHSTGAPVGRASPFDRVKDIDAVDPRHEYVYRDFPYTVYQPGPLPRIRPGDYLVVSPQSTKGYDAEYIRRLQKDYELVFHTNSPLAVPSIHLKTWVKYWLSQRLTREQKIGGAMVSENLWNWPDYYVFVRR